MGPDAQLLVLITSVADPDPAKVKEQINKTVKPVKSVKDCSMK